MTLAFVFLVAKYEQAENGIFNALPKSVILHFKRN
jgi:hypothetical protein